VVEVVKVVEVVEVACPGPLSRELLEQLSAKAEVRGRWGWPGVFTCETERG